MRELLQQALDALRTRANGRTVQTFDEASMYAVEKQIEAELASHEWVKFADALPVVPEGKFSVRIWAFRADKGKVFRANWWQHYGFQKINFTHWQYRQDDTPAPPEAE